LWSISYKKEKIVLRIKLMIFKNMPTWRHEKKESLPNSLYSVWPGVHFRVLAIMGGYFMLLKWYYQTPSGSIPKPARTSVAQQNYLRQHEMPFRRVINSYFHSFPLVCERMHWTRYRFITDFAYPFLAHDRNAYAARSWTATFLYNIYIYIRIYYYFANICTVLNYGI